MNPPNNAVVFSFDEKSQIQALERAQPIQPIATRANRLRELRVIAVAAACRRRTLPRVTRMFACLLVGTTASACAADPRSIVIGPRHVGTDHARVTGVFETPSGGHNEGLTRSENMPWSAIVDEAVLVRMPPGELCVDLTLRSAVGYDEPLDAYVPELTVDRVRVEAAITAGPIVRHADSVERHGRICAQVATARSVHLHMTHPKLTFRSLWSGRVYRYELGFTWRIK